MKKKLIIAVVVFLILVACAALAPKNKESVDSPTKTAQPTKTAKPTKTPAPTSTAGPTETPAPTNTLAPTKTPRPTKTPTPDVGSEAMAYVMCTEFVSEKIENAKFPPKPHVTNEVGEQKWAFKGYADSTEWICRIEYKGDNLWELITPIELID